MATFKPQYSLLPDIAIGRKVTIPVLSPQTVKYPFLLSALQTAKKEI